MVGGQMADDRGPYKLIADSSKLKEKSLKSSGLEIRSRRSEIRKQWV